MMKKLLPFALLLLLFTACIKEGDAPLTPIDPVVSFNYTEDARQILFRLMQNGSVTTGVNDPEFSAQELDKILQNIQAVYNLKTRQTDSIFNISKVHVYPHVNLHGIVLQINQTSAEGKNIVKHQPSGNGGFDALMAKYQFVYYGDLSLPNYGFVGITSLNAYNIPPLLTAFKNYPFIVNAQQDGYIGDGNDIGYVINNSGVDLDFAVKSGDCPAGCIIRHGWRYHVNNVFKVTYLGNY